MSQPKRDPTPQQIAAACLQIQAGWSPEVRLRRLRSDERPVVGTCDGRLLEVTAEGYAVHGGRGASNDAGPWGFGSLSEVSVPKR